MLMLVLCSVTNAVLLIACGLYFFSSVLLILLHDYIERNVSKTISLTVKTNLSIL